MNSALEFEQHLLAVNASVPEKALASMGVLLDKLEDPIATMWNPWTCPIETIPFLAWALRVPLWDEGWSESKKRSILAESPDLNATKGTYHALKRYVEIMGGKAVNIAAAPQGIYLEIGQSQEDYQTWLDQFPEIRIYDDFGPEAGDLSSAYMGEYLPETGAVPEAFYLDTYNPKPVRRAVLIEDEKTTNLNVLETRTHLITGETQIEETYFITAYSPYGFFLNQSYTNDLLDNTAELVFLSLDNNQPRTPLSSVLISNIPQRVFEEGLSDDFYMSEDAVSINYLMENTAHRLIYESYRLHHKNDNSQTLPSGFCLGDPDYYHLPNCNLLIDIDASSTLPNDTIFADNYIGSFLDADNGDWRARLFDAAAAANPTSDKTLASSKLHRAAKFSDNLTMGSYRFGDFIPFINPSAPHERDTSHA